MKHHCRCAACNARKCLRKHPAEYRNRKVCKRCKVPNLIDAGTCTVCKAVLVLGPKCRVCGGRAWRRDEYRHAVELPLMRSRAGRYVPCRSDCHPFHHRIGSNGCKFIKPGVYRE